ncbi:MAG: hypothetical protein KDD70_08115 [Bdellovibrionales bacterium]|nr:hypothetical protein [Bdellovibrionales bacterium]
MTRYFDTDILDTQTVECVADTINPFDTVVPREPLAQTEISIAETYELQPISEPEFSAGATATMSEPGGSTILDTARLAGEVLLQQKGKVVTVTRNLFLIASGLALGVGIALSASYNHDPIVSAAILPTEKVVSVPAAVVEQSVAVSTEVATAGLVVEERLVELEQWFQSQPVPVEERVFLHQAQQSFKTRTVNFQAPAGVDSQFADAGAPVSFQKVSDKDGRYLADGKNGLEWQGDFGVSSPSANVNKGANYLKELESKFGVNGNGALNRIEQSTSGSIAKGAEQRVFGPKVR